MSSTTTTTSNTKTGVKPMKPAGFMERLYNGDANIPFVEKRRRWYTLLIIVTLVCLAAIGIRGFNLGIDFEGGTRISMPPAAEVSEESVQKTFEDATGVKAEQVQTVGSGDSRIIEITSERLPEQKIVEARTALFEAYHPKNTAGEVNEDAINDSTVSESWGGSITQRMLLALGVFLLIVFAYIAIRMERDMAISAIVAIISDLIVVSGIYALLGLEVSPATVIGLLTILAYSLYDTVVVFDKVYENTQGLFNSTRRTYAEQVNLAVNQTVMRSINTSLFSLVPILSLLVIAVGLMGVGTLKDLALVQFIGVIVGTFSSIMFAAPFLVSIKSRQKKFKEHAQRVERARRARTETPIDENRNGNVDAEPQSENLTDGSAGAAEARPAKRNDDKPGIDRNAGRSWRPGL